MIPNKPLLAADWKQIHLPTLNWRSKILMNSIKWLALGDLHNPNDSQESEFIDFLSTLDIGNSKLLDHRTYKKYWLGETLPTESKTQYFRNILRTFGPNYESLIDVLDPKQSYEPLIRHLRSIDGRNLELEKRKNSQILSFKEDIANDTLKSIRKVWSIFIDPFYIDQGRFDLTKQVAGISLRQITQPENPSLLDTNYYATSLPSTVTDSHTISDPHTLLSFLLNLGAHLSPLSKEELAVWAMDLASVTSACLTKQYTSLELAPSNYFGKPLIAKIGFAARMYWDNYNDPSDSIEMLSFCIEDQSLRSTFLETLYSARAYYYEAFSRYGISPSDVMEKLHLFTDLGHPLIPFGLTRNGKVILRNNHWDNFGTVG